MFSFLFIVTFVLVGSSSAKKCINFTIPLNLNARQGTYAVPEPTTNEDVTFFTQNLTTIRDGGNFSDRVLTGYQTVTGLYNISATFCTPDTKSPSPVVQVLTHGLGSYPLAGALSEFTHILQVLTDLIGTIPTTTSATATSMLLRTSIPTVRSFTTALELGTPRTPTQLPLSRRQLS